MENLTGGNPPVRPLPCVVPCKLYFIYTNYDLFKKIKVTDSGNLVEQTHDLLNSNDTFEMIHEKIYKMLRAGKSEQKAEFALDVIFEISPDELSVPPYINQGLMWLQDYLHPED